MEEKKIIIIVIAIMTAVSYIMGLIVFKGSLEMTDNQSTNLASIEAWLEDDRDFVVIDFKAEYVIESIEIESSSGEHQIPADYISTDGNKDRDTVVMVHGLGANRLSVYPMAEVFLENGYNVIAYDQRSSGENTASYNTFGYLERKDLRDYLDFVKEKISSDKKLGVWGASFGGATVGSYLGLEHANKKVDFAILDSPLSSMEYMIRDELESMNLGILANYMKFMGELVTRIRLGFSYQDVDIPIQIAQTEVPVLVMHSKIDQITPYFMGQDIYQAIEHDNKEMLTFKDSKHVEMYFDYPKQYEASIVEFLKDFVKIN